MSYNPNVDLFILHINKSSICRWPTNKAELKKVDPAEKQADLEFTNVEDVATWLDMRSKHACPQDEFRTSVQRSDEFLENGYFWRKSYDCDSDVISFGRKSFRLNPESGPAHTSNSTRTLMPVT